MSYSAVRTMNWRFGDTENTTPASLHDMQPDIMISETKIGLRLTYARFSTG